jgi:TM2 domain-containing membrane protein YozV
MIERSSPLKSLAVNYNSLSFYLIKDFSSLTSNYQLNSDLDVTDTKKLLLVSSILNENIFPSNEQILIFDNSDRLFLNDLINKKKYPDYKSATIAGILSIIPGAGKVYTTNYTDGLTSFLLTGLFTFLAYDNFRNSHHFRGYLFSFAAIGFYLGNIYGSIVSAHRYNRNYNEKIITETDDYLKKKNYFIKKVNFCE